MSAMRRLVLSGAIAALGLAAAVAAALFFDIDRHKARLEAAASQLLGMQVRIGGPLGMAFVPGLQVTANEVQIGLNGLELASAKQARIAIDILPLLRGQLQIGAIALESPRIAIERDRQGHFNFEATGADTATLPALDWPSVSLTHAALVYADKQSAELVSASDCRMDLHRVRLAGGKPSELLRGLSFTAELACTELRGAGLVMSALKSQIEVKDGAVDLKPLTMNVLGAPGAGSVRADFSGSVPSYSVRYALPQFAIEEFFKALSPKKIASGRMDFSANLKMHGSTARERRQSLQGELVLRGRKLALIGADVDAQLSRIESSQNFNLVDMGAFFVAGPLGLAFTKGYDFASVFTQPGTHSEIVTLLSDWKVEHGVARAHDVALATRGHRIALRGALDLANERFDEVAVALIDGKGCATLRQQVRGTFTNPLIDKPNPIASLTGPALSLLRKGREVLTGGQCDVFYAGSVTAPK